MGQFEFLFWNHPEKWIENDLKFHLKKIKIKLISLPVDRGKTQPSYWLQFGKVKSCCLENYTSSYRKSGNYWCIFFSPSETKKSRHSAIGFSYHVCFSLSPILVFREAIDILSKSKNYSKLNGNLDSSARAQNKSNFCPSENWYIFVSGHLLAACSWPGTMAHQQQEGWGASVLDKNEIQFPGMSFFRGREEREEYSWQQMRPQMLAMDGTLLSTFQNPLPHLISPQWSVWVC